MSDTEKLPKVDLGTYSFLIIAFIVTVCSGSEHHSDTETRQKIDELRQSVTRLEKKVDALNTATRKPSAKATEPAAPGTQP